MRTFQSNEVHDKYNSYPSDVKLKLLELRELIYDVADEEDRIGNIEEVLKWNEPSYVSKNGSTLRVDWKKSKPNQYSIYFNCNTKLVKTFRELFSDKFQFEGNREIVLQKDKPLETKNLKYCILLSLTYHDRKHLAMLDE